MLLLAADPVLGGLALELVELGAVDLALGELGPGLREVVGLGVGADGGGYECGGLGYLDSWAVAASAFTILCHQ